MFTLKIKRHFDAAHHLLNYDGPCSRVHGHRFDVIVEFRFDDNSDNGMCADFKKLKNIVDYVLGALDHHDLNELIEQPTAEWIAVILYRDLKKLSDNISSVRVFESPDCEVEYVEEA